MAHFLGDFFYKDNSLYVYAGGVFVCSLNIVFVLIIPKWFTGYFSRVFTPQVILYIFITYFVYVKYFLCFFFHIWRNERFFDILA